VAVEPAFWRGRRVLVTGHTGFKGSWLSLWLSALGAEVIGLSAGVPTQPSLFELCDVQSLMTGVRADVRDEGAVLDAVGSHRPEIVLHLAAQPFVRRSFRDPRGTYEVNVMGTVNVLEAARVTEAVRVVVNVTSDKCYDNRNLGRPFAEDDPKGGHDPYSSSKGCAELVADAYHRSFFAGRPEGLRLGSARAGNVIGGGDWGEDRLIPDFMRGALADAPIRVRNPDAVRPWQHVLNPLSGYLILAQALWDSAELEVGWNFGPPATEARPVGWLIERLTQLWPHPLRWEVDPGPHPHEARSLSLDSTRAHRELGWRPRWDLEDALGRTVEWYQALDAGDDMRRITFEQIEAFSA